MIRPWMAYGGVLALGLGLSWVRYTSDEKVTDKEGVVLADERRDDLSKIEYTSADLDVVVELRKDALGSYAWVTVSDHKQKKGKEGEPPPPVETKVTSFKAGSAGDKLLDGVAPLVALRELVGLDTTKLDTYGLKEPASSLAVTAGGRTATLELGGETYGTKDLYAKHRESSRYYVVDDELIKPLKFAGTRLPERNLFASKVEELDRVALSQGGKVVAWTQHNKDDRNADWWERLATPGTDEVGKKDETFANWLEKALKLKSQAYVQKDEVPEAAESVFEITFSVQGKPDETLRVSKTADAWYGQGDFTRGLVKLTKSTVEDAAGEVDDILEGREPPPDATPAPAADDGPPRPPLSPPGMPGRPGLPIPAAKPPATP